MKQDEVADVVFKIGSEGFDYCFDGYSDWSEVEDARFHELREQFVKAKQELQSYLEDQAIAHDMVYEELLG